MNDLDAPRPVRVFLVGLVLGVVLLSGFGLWGLAAHDTPPRGWEQAIIVDRDTGSRYVQDAKSKLLHPVLNWVSARLAMPAHTPVMVVPHRTIMAAPMGSPIGIPGAPDALPASGAQVRDWTVCTQPAATGLPARTLLVGVGVRRADAVAADSAVLVRTPGGGRWVISGGRRFEVRDDAALRGFLRAGAPAGDPEVVGQDWLELFPAGSPIDFPSLTGLNEPAPTDLPAGVNRVGVVVRVPGVGGQRYLVTSRGLAPVSETVADVVMSDPRNQQNTGDIQPISPAAVNRTASTSTPYGPADWPSSRPKARDTRGANVLCAQDSTPRGPAGATPTLSAGAVLPDDRAADARIPTQAAGGPTSVFVRPGASTLAQAAVGDSDAGAIFLVSATGRRFQILPPDPDPQHGPPQLTLEDTLRQLGLASPPVRVAPAWLAFLPAGPSLNHTTATQYAPAG